MILNEFITIKTNRKTEKWFKDKGYKFNVGDTITIKIVDLNHGSHLEIDVKCDVCGHEKTLWYQQYVKNIKKCGYYACSSKCAQEKVKIKNLELFGSEHYSQTSEYAASVLKTCMEKYGVEHFTKLDSVKEKSRQTSLEKYGKEYYTQTEEYKKQYNQTCQNLYGVDNLFQAEEIKEKSKKTCLEKYGTEYYSQTEKSKEQIKQTCLDKYGFDSSSKCEEIKTKVKQSFLKNYGVDNIFKNKEFIEENKIKFRNYMKNKILSENKDFVGITDAYEYIMKCDCGKDHIFTINPHLYRNRKNYDTPLCVICNPIGKQKSGVEFKMFQFIEEHYKGEILRNKRKPLDNEYEMDVYLPELKLAIEFNGIYWHNEHHKPKDYHRLKIEACEKKGIELFQVWEDDWKYNFEIIKSMILGKINVYERIINSDDCEIKYVKDSKTIKDFLVTNHIQGYIGSNIKIGLYYENELISLLCLNDKKDGKFEIKRFCTKLNNNVIGGDIKLFEFFKSEYKPDEISVILDRSNSNGSEYIELGFEVIKKTQPIYYYVVDDLRLHRFNFRKEILIKENFDEDMSEIEIMEMLGINRVYDSGNLKLIYNKTSP